MMPSTKRERRRKKRSRRKKAKKREAWRGYVRSRERQRDIKLS